MKELTFRQATHLLILIDQSGITCEQLQDLFNSGLLSDLLISNLSQIDRQEFRKICGLATEPEWKKVVLMNNCTRYQITGRKFPDVLDEVFRDKKISYGTSVEIGKTVSFMFGGNRCDFYPYRTEQREEGFIRIDVVFKKA